MGSRVASAVNDLVDLGYTVGAGRPPSTPAGRGEGGRGGFARATLIIAATAGVAAFATRIVHVPDVNVLFLVGVMLVAYTSGRGASLLATGLAVITYDFFFVPPEFQLRWTDARYLLTFATMFGVSLVIQSLTLRLREQRRAALVRERRTAALHALSYELAAAFDEAGIAGAVEKAASHAAGAEALLLVVGPEGLRSLVDPARESSLSSSERAAARWAADHGRPAGRGTDVLAHESVLCVPIHRFAGGHAVLVVRSSEPAGPSAEIRRLEALARITAVALDRVRFAEDARREKLRTGLLSSVSHDLRTPLATITGAATALCEDPGLDGGTRRELTESIVEEAERLERLVSNLLDMTRLDQGAVAARREWVPVEEVVGSALTRLEPRLAGRPIRTVLGPELPLLFVDPVLLEQLLVNLLENAAKYTPPGSAIEVCARRDGESLFLDVADRGPGLAPGEEERIFDRFYRGERSGSHGVGLGLSIARAIAVVHGGRLTAENRREGGALFRLELPVPAQAPPPLEVQEAEEWTAPRSRGGP